MAPSGPQFHSPPVTEQDLPGIGRRYDLRGSTATAWPWSSTTPAAATSTSSTATARPTASLTLTDGQARTLGAILGGAYFKPAVVEEIEAVIGGLLIDWVTLRDDSPGVGRSIAELEIRRRTRMTVAAILRDGDADHRPRADERLPAGRPARRRRPARGPARLPRGTWSADVGDELVALGGALPRRRLLARLGRRVGLPTIPLLHGRRHPLRARTRRASRSSTTPTTSELLAALGLVLLLFHLGLEFSLGDLAAGGRRLLGAGADLPRRSTSAAACSSASPSAGAPPRRSSSRARSASRRRPSSPSCWSSCAGWPTPRAG